MKQTLYVKDFSRLPQIVAIQIATENGCLAIAQVLMRARWISIERAQ